MEKDNSITPGSNKWPDRCIRGQRILIFTFHDFSAAGIFWPRPPGAIDIVVFTLIITRQISIREVHLVKRTSRDSELTQSIPELFWKALWAVAASPRMVDVEVIRQDLSSSRYRT